MNALEFWFDFASPYSYLSAMRIEHQAHEQDIKIVWKPFLLGPIFAKQGWQITPFVLYPAKGAYMKRDLERLCLDRGLPPFRLPDPMPAHSVLASRIALIGLDKDWGVAFCKATFEAEFAQGFDIKDEDVLAGILRDVDQEPADVMAQALHVQNKQRLREQTEQAERRGIFGAPSFITTNGDLFWGDDRLEQALSFSLATEII